MGKETSRPLSTGLWVTTGKPEIAKYFKDATPWGSIQEVLTNIPLSERHLGLTVRVGSDEYCFEEGIGDGDLVKKIKLTKTQLNAIASVANKADKITEQIVNPNPTTGTTPTKHTATFQINQKEAEVFIDLGLISLLEITHPTVNSTTYTILKFKITGTNEKKLAFTSKDSNVKFINNSSTDAINNITLFGNSEALKSSIYTFKLVHQVIGAEKKVFINYTNSKEF